MKTKYSSEIKDLGHQLDHIIPKKNQQFHDYGANFENARIFLIIFSRREIEIIGDGKKLIEVKAV